MENLITYEEIEGAVHELQGSPELLTEVVEELEEQGIVTWDALLAAHSLVQQNNEVGQVLQRLCRTGAVF